MNNLKSAPARWDMLLLILVSLHLLLKAALASTMIHAGPSGDEWAYMDAAKALSNALRDLLRLAPLDVSELQVNVVGNGWFMPGMSLLAMPLYLVAPDAGIVTLRLYLGLITFVLWLWTVLALRRYLGVRFACAFLILPSLIPMWVMFSFTFWGEVSAGLVLVILLTHSFSMLCQYRTGMIPSSKEACGLGVLAASALYLRSSSLPLLPLLFLGLLLASWLLLPKKLRFKAIANLAIACSMLLGLVLPWSLAASATLRAPVLTTTSVPLSLAITFGNTNRLCNGPCPRGEIWLTATRYSREIALSSGHSAVQVQKAMARNALHGLSARRYASRVLGNFDRYLLHPTGFLPRFMPVVGKYRSAVATITNWLYYASLAAFAIGLFAVYRHGFTTQATSVLLKLFGLALLLQPFIHISHGRYWPGFAPLCGLALGILLSRRIDQHPATIMDYAPEPSPALTWAQALLSIAMASSITGLFFLARL